MAGYTRVDTINNIADGNVINAADLDGEFDGIQAAFNSSTGHNHDGTAGEGAPILALGPAQDVTISSSVLGVKTTNIVDLGTSSLKFKDFYLAGAASIGGALTYGGVTLSSAVTGTGNMVLSASPTLTGTITAAAANFSGAVALNGNSTIGDASADTVTVNGTLTSNLIFTDNTYDIGASGATRPRTGYFGTSVFSPLVDATNLEVTNIKALDGTTNISIASSTGIATFSKATVVETTDNTNAALRITQLGTGNALLVEDSANPDSSPFVIDSAGAAILGTTASATLGLTGQQLQVQTVAAISGAGALFAGWNATQPNAINLARSQSGTIGTNGVVSSGAASSIRFFFDDGTNFIRGAAIEAAVDGTPGTNDMPGRLVFSTTADGASTPTERVRIDSAGQTKFSYNAVVEVTDNTNAALRITQLGTGNALLVEDSANPDSSPFVITADGRFIHGHTSALSPRSVTFSNQFIGSDFSGSAPLSLRYSNDTSPTGYEFSKTRSTTPSGNAIVSSGDSVGTLIFSADDGTQYVQAASITAAVDGTPGTNDMPGRLVFSTTADGASTPTERFRIRSDGNVGIGDGGSLLGKISIGGTLTTSSSNSQVFRSVPTIPSTTTSNYRTYLSAPITQAASFTLTTLNHFSADPQTLGAGSSVTNQYGFSAESTLTGATNNYGFYGNIAAASGRYNFYAAGTAENFFGGNTVISVTDNTNAALRITQLGTGNALLVEDSTNPDSSPFVIDANGSVFAGYTSAETVSGFSGAHTPKLQVSAASGTTNGAGLFNYSSGATGAPQLSFAKSKSGVVGTRGVVSSGDTLGALSFNGDDGTNFINAATIVVAVDGTPGTNDMPGRLVFSTTADGASTSTERMRIDSAGDVGIGTTTPVTKLEIAGSNNTTWQVVASITGTTMDVTSVTTSGIAVGDLVIGSAVQAYTRVTALGTGTGGVGTYTVNVSQTVASATLLGGPIYGNTLIRITETDTQQSAGQPTGGLQFYTSDASTPTAGVGAYVAAVAESNTPDTALVFGTRDNGGGGIDANERMRIDSSGNVMVGATSSSFRLRVQGAVTDVGEGDTNVLQGLISTTAQAAGVGPSLLFSATYDGGSGLAGMGSIAGIKENSTSGNYAGALKFMTRPNGSNLAERMRIDSSGNLLVGTTSARAPLTVQTAPSSSAYGQIAAFSAAASDVGNAGISVTKYDNVTTTSQVFARFLVNQGVTASGQINANGASAAAFGSYSDSRLKENIVDLPSQLGNIMALRTVEFDYIESEGGGHQIGFIAQEVQAIYPDLVGEREDGMLTLTDMNKNDARLIKAIQELKAINDTQAETINALTARIVALEAN